ncbi:hypothetical protein LguiB_013586 [Lonicera macranthoides]
MQIQSKTIYEILNLHSDSSSEEIVLTCKATIYGIDKEAGWFYNSCRLCGKKVKENGSTFWCSKCNNDEQFPKPRYKLHVQVKDESASTTFVIFDKEAEKILKVPVTQLYKGKNILESISSIPDGVTQIIGNTYEFQLKLNQFNLVKGLENYTVTTIASTESVPTSASIRTNQEEDSSDNSITIESSDKDTQSQVQRSSTKLNKRKYEKHKLNEAQTKKPKTPKVIGTN